MLTRRQIVTGCLAFLAQSIFPVTIRRSLGGLNLRQISARYPLLGKALYNDVVTYDSLGEHSTATPSDNRTADWLASELHAAGCSVELQEFEVPLFSVKRSSLQIDGHDVDIFPRWPATSTGSKGICARLAPWSSNDDGLGSRPVEGRIAVGRLAYGEDRLTTAAWIQKAVAVDAQAVLIITEHPTGEIVAENTPCDAPPFGVPVGLIGEKHAVTLERTIATRSEATLILDGEFIPNSKAYNIIGKLDRGPGCIVVMTPHSGWFHCAGERGGGVALLLGLARWAAGLGSTKSFRFVTASGHELGMVGENKYIEELAPTLDEISLWLHLGASIGTRKWLKTPIGLWPLPFPNAGTLAAHRALLEKVKSHFADCGSYPNPVDSEIFMANFEKERKRRQTQDFVGVAHYDASTHFAYYSVLRAGYKPSMAVFGGHIHKHTPADRPGTTTARFLQSVSHGVADVIEELVL